MQKKKAFLLQLQAGKEMVLFDSPNQLLTKSPLEIFREVKNAAKSSGYKWGWKDLTGRINILEYDYSTVISPRMSNHFGLQNGDQITYMISDLDHHVVILEINDHPVKLYFPIEQLRSEYPTQVLPIDSFGFPSIRVAQGMAPIGLGSCCFMQGPGGSGKSSMQYEFTEAVFRLTNYMPIRVIQLCAGERSKDVGIYYRIEENVPHAKTQVERYEAPVGVVGEANQWYLCEYLFRRARALARMYHTIFAIDSLHPMVEAISSTMSEGGMFSGGLYTEALYTVRREVSITGNFGDSSLTIFANLLGNAQNNTSGGLDELAKRTADNVSDVLWSLVANPTLGYPRVDVDVTRFLSRRQGTFVDPRQLAEEAAVEQLKWMRGTDGKATNKAEEAHAAMLAYYRSKPIPPWAMFPPKDGVPIVPYHLQAMGGNIPIAKQLAYLLGQEATEKVQLIAQNRGVSTERILENAVEFYLRALDAGAHGRKIFIGAKPGDIEAQLVTFPVIQTAKINPDQNNSNGK